MIMKPVPTVEDARLNKFIDKTPGPGKCWSWTGCLVGGYGTLTYKGQVHKAHRLVLQKVVPRSDTTTYACHTCDNPSCCNPEHLYWGSPKQNAADRVGRGRHKSPVGVIHHKAKLDPIKVQEIRQLAGTMSQRALAKRFGVAQGVIWNVIHRKFWKEVT